jgi:hypothetical protein
LYEIAGQEAINESNKSQVDIDLSLNLAQADDNLPDMTRENRNLFANLISHVKNNKVSIKIDEELTSSVEEFKGGDQENPH